MIDLGVVKPGTLLYIPFATYSSDDPVASVTITDLAVTDIEIYKDGSVTQRASDAGYTLLDTDGIDFDSVVGVHGISINLADNTTAGFYAAGSSYWVVVASVTLDGATVNFISVTFTIGYPDAVINTTIATLASQTSFTVTDGPAEDDVLNGCSVCIHDVASKVQLGFAVVLDYVGSTKTVTLAAGTTFAVAVTDNIAIYPPTSVAAVQGSVVAANNLKSQYDASGLTGDTFPATQAQMSSITNSGSAVNTVADSYVLTTGTQSSGTVTSTKALDGTNHEHTDDTGVLNLYYKFFIGSGSPSSVTVDGYLNGNNDNLEVYGYDWVASDWVRIGTLVGRANPINETNTYQMTTAMVGTGVNLGEVRFQYTDGAFTLTSATLAIDRVLLSFNQAAGGYSDGIEVDTNASNTNTVPGIDGVKGNPVSTWAAALTLSASTGIEEFKIVNGSSFSLTGNSDNYTMKGRNWTLALNGQSISGISITGASVSGIGTGAQTPDFIHCHIDAVTLPPCHITNCGLDGPVTAGSAGEFFLDNAHSMVAGLGAFVFDFGGALNASNLHARGLLGGIEIQNMGAGTGTYNMSLEGHGQLIINANCSATSNVVVRGHFTITDNAAGAVIVSDDARYDIGHETYVLVRTTIATLASQISFTLTKGSSNDNAYEGAIAIIEDATTKVQKAFMLISGYTGGTKTVALAVDPGIFTMAVGDTITIVSMASVPGVWDRILTGAKHNIITSSGKRVRQIQIGAYENGAVWIDTVNGVAGTVNYENGTVDNPVDSLADATTLGASLGLNIFRLKPGSSILLEQTYNNCLFVGCGWTLALGGQDVGGSTFEGAYISGTSAGALAHYQDCTINTVSLAPARAVGCALTGPITLNSAGDYYFAHSYSTVAGTSAPIVDFGASVGSTNVNFRDYSGGVDLRNMGQVGTDNMSLEGRGQLIVNANCTGGTIAIRGNFTLTDNGAATISDDARVDVGQINSEADTALSDYGGPTNAQMEARTLVAANYALSSVLGALNNAASDGDPTATDTLMQYVKQLINILVGAAGVVTFPVENPPANGVSLAEVIRAIHTDVTGLNGSAMRGTNGANTTVPDPAGTAPTAPEIVNEWEAQSQADPTGFQVNLKEIDGGSQEATNLKNSAGTMVNGTVDSTSFAPTTTEFEADDITEATAEHYNGRLIIFRPAGALGYQATAIEDYALVGGRGHFTVTALTEAPLNNVTFIIV